MQYNISLKRIMKLSWVHLIYRPVEPSMLESPEPPELSRRQGITGWRMRVWFHQDCP